MRPKWLLFIDAVVYSDDVVVDSDDVVVVVVVVLFLLSMGVGASFFAQGGQRSSLFIEPEIVSFYVHAVAGRSGSVTETIPAKKYRVDVGMAVLQYSVQRYCCATNGTLYNRFCCILRRTHAVIPQFAGVLCRRNSKTCLSGYSL